MRKLGRLLPDALARHEVLLAARAQSTLRRWSEVVGPFLAERSQPDRFHRGTVWVAVEGSAWAQELRMMKDDILARLNEISSDGAIFREIRFGVRPFSPLPEEPPPPEVETAPAEDAGLTIRQIAERRLAQWPQDESGN